MALTAFAAPHLPAFSRVACADTTVSAKDQKKAADLFKKAGESYRKGEFQTTIDLLTQAYALDPQPVLLYNLARAHEGLGNTDQAIEAYEKFLAQDPKTNDRGSIEQRLTTLRRQREDRIAAQKAREAEQSKANSAPAKQPPPPAAVPPPREEPKPEPKRSVLPYVVAGTGVALIGVGAVTGILAKSGESDANAEPIHARAVDERDSAESMATVSTITFIAGGALLVVGAGWFFLDAPKKTTASTSPANRDPSLARALTRNLAVGPGYIGLTGTLP